MKVSWLELGDIWPAKPAKQMQAKIVSFLANGQFYTGMPVSRGSSESWVKPVKLFDNMPYSPMDLLGRRWAAG